MPPLDAEIGQTAYLKADERRAVQAYLINGSPGRGTVSVRLGARDYWICTSDPIGDVPEREAAVRLAGVDAWMALEQLVRGRAAAGEAGERPLPGVPLGWRDGNTPYGL